MIMTNPNSRIVNPNDFKSNPGSQFEVLYDTKVLDDGSIVLRESGKRDLKAEINSFKDQTDIAYIIKQLQLGNSSVLNPRTPMYDDFTGAPRDLREAMQIMIDGEKAFYQLDLDTRQKFDNDFRKWLVSAGSDQWLRNMNIVKDNVVSNEPDSEVKE